MFEHQGAILRKFNSSKGSFSQTHATGASRPDLRHKNWKSSNVKIPYYACQQAHLHIAVTTTPYSKEPLLLHVRSCFHFLFVYKHLWQLDVFLTVHHELTILITNVMYWLLFIHKILFSSTCFEPQLLIFRRIQLYTCSIWYRHSLWEYLVACRYTAWVRTDRRGKVVGRAS